MFLINMNVSIIVEVNGNPGTFWWTFHQILKCNSYMYLVCATSNRTMSHCGDNVQTDIHGQRKLQRDQFRIWISSSSTNRIQCTKYWRTCSVVHALAISIIFIHLIML